VYEYLKVSWCIIRVKRKQISEGSIYKELKYIKPHPVVNVYGKLPIRIRYAAYQSIMFNYKPIFY